MNKLANLLVVALLCVGATKAFVARGNFTECGCNSIHTEILKADRCEKIICEEDGEGELGNLQGCGVSSIRLTDVQILRGCEVKQKEVSRSVRYPECCEKYVDCPPLGQPSKYNSGSALKRFLGARQK